MGLYFELNEGIYYDGDSVLISDIEDQPADRSDPGSTLVCVTTNVNTACCRGSDGGAVGEWLYPDGTIVPRPGGNPVDFARVGYAQQVRLARSVSTSPPPLGVYTCEVPDQSGGSVGVSATATISLVEQGMTCSQEVIPFLNSHFRVLVTLVKLRYVIYLIL